MCVSLFTRVIDHSVIGILGSPGVSKLAAVGSLTARALGILAEIGLDAVFAPEMNLFSDQKHQ